MTRNPGATSRFGQCDAVAEAGAQCGQPGRGQHGHAGSRFRGPRTKGADEWQREAVVPSGRSPGGGLRDNDPL